MRGRGNCGSPSAAALSPSSGRQRRVILMELLGRRMHASPRDGCNIRKSASVLAGEPWSSRPQRLVVEPHLMRSPGCDWMELGCRPVRSHWPGWQTRRRLSRRAEGRNPRPRICSGRQAEREIAKLGEEMAVPVLTLAGSRLVLGRDRHRRVRPRSRRCPFVCGGSASPRFCPGTPALALAESVVTSLRQPGALEWGQRARTHPP